MKTVPIHVRVKASSSRAVFIQLENGEECWVPLSLMDLDETDVELTVGSEGEMAIAEWFVERESLE